MAGMRPVGIAGRRSHGYGTRRGNKAKQAEYRHSEAGMQARRMRNMNPEVRAHNALRRKVHRQLETGH